MSSSAAQQQGRVAYRRLLRAAKDVFRGDAFAMAESRKVLRGEFESKRTETDPEKLKKAWAAVDEAEDFLRHNLVQARLKNDNTYAVTLPAQPPGAKGATGSHANIEFQHAGDVGSKSDGGSKGSGCCSL